VINDLEGILFGDFDVNDGERYSIESLTFKPAEAKPQWADNADADGAVLVQEPHYTNAYFELQIRVEPAADSDQALEAVGDLLDAVHAAKRTTGGLPIPWTPNGATRTYTWYCLLGELEELPIESNGELAGWFFDSPVVKVKLTCRPFGYGEERVVLDLTTSSEPLQEVFIGGIQGDVPAEATLRVTDKANQDRRYVEWGQDLVGSAVGNPALELTVGGGLDTEGFSGALAVRAGSRSASAAKVTLGQKAVVICSTGAVQHVGSFKLSVRNQSARGALFRVSYRDGDGPWTSLPWVSGGSWTQSVPTDWRSIGLGEAFLDEVEKGEQASELRIEGKMEEGFAKQTAYVDLLDLMPSRRWGRGRAPINLITPSAYSVSDPFDQAEGNATGKEADVGGVYAAIANSAETDFTVAGGKLMRTAVADGGTIGTWPFSGRAIGTPGKFKNVAAAFDYRVGAAALESSRWGFLLAYVDNTHFVLVNLARDKTGKVKALVNSPSGTVLGESDYLSNYAGLSTEFNLTCEGTLLVITTGSRLTVYSESAYEPLRPVVQVENALVGVEGKVAIYDQKREAGGGYIREYDNLSVWVPDVPVVCPSGRALEIRADAEEREDAAGIRWSPLPQYRGGHFLLDPAGKDDLVNRVAVKMRRANLTEDVEANLTDPQGVEVLARERFLAPR
jgi:hypothetical protein